MKDRAAIEIFDYSFYSLFSEKKSFSHNLSGAQSLLIILLKARFFRQHLFVLLLFPTKGKRRLDLERTY